MIKRINHSKDHVIELLAMLGLDLNLKWKENHNTLYVIVHRE